MQKYSTTNIAYFLHQQAKLIPDNIAVIDRYHNRDRHTTFAELEKSSIKLANQLIKTGIKPGDRVLVLCNISPELYIVLSAAFRLGLVAMFIDISAGRKFIEHCCASHPPRALISSSKLKFLYLFFSHLRNIPHKITIDKNSLDTNSCYKTRYLSYDGSIYPCEHNTPALLTFTSGVTDRPKAVIRSHGFLTMQYHALSDSISLNAPGNYMTALPIFVLNNIASGNTSIIPDCDLRHPGRINAKAVISQLKQNNISDIIAAPAFLDCLVDHCTKESIQLDFIKKIFVGGGPVYPNALEKLSRIAPDSRIIMVYGSSEAEPIAVTKYDEISGEDFAAMCTGMGLLAGQPVPGIRLKIIDDTKPITNTSYDNDTFNGICCKPGIPGEIVVTGNHVLTTYPDANDNTNTQLAVDGAIWHRTGDAGYQDNKGNLWLLGRCSARVSDAKGVVYAFQVEPVVLSVVPAASKAALVSVDGKRILAIELKNYIDYDLNKLKKITAQARIDSINIVRKLPVDKRHNAKVDYNRTKKMLMRPKLACFFHKHFQ